ncbi:MAG: winged helix-turn-helix transcriptional regulator [Anaerohalosphaera sp.]|nr:winged helix-turn-helix transcriptional regulator [Anaerohalosphaera sp.]
MVNKQRRKYLESVAEIIRATSHPVRLAIIEILANGERCVCEITELVDANRPNISKHLSLMLRSGILNMHKDGLKTMYSLKSPCVLQFIKCGGKILKKKLEDQLDLLPENMLSKDM